MEIVNLLHLSSRDELRKWLMENHDKVACCCVVTYRSKCAPGLPAISYVEVVEEALCFGWIDSTLKRLPDGRLAQRLSPRRAKSHWTQLNIDRCASLEARGLMTEAGRAKVKGEKSVVKVIGHKLHHHFVSYGDAGHSTRYTSMLDMQVA